MKPAVGVAEERLSYAGVIPNLELQFSDNIKVNA
jgi:hypothetical protein